MIAIIIPTHTIKIAIDGGMFVTPFKIAVAIVMIPDTNEIPSKYFIMLPCYMTN